MDEDRYLYSPLGIMFVTMGENHEQVSFAYPFHGVSSFPSGIIVIAILNYHYVV